MIKDKVLTFIDLETTGSKAGNDKIIEIGLIQYLNGEIIFEYETLINPQKSIPHFISLITGISDQDVLSAPTFNDVAFELYEKIKDTILIAHNASFDYSFLRQEFLSVGIQLINQVLCSVKLSRELYPEFKKHSLDSLIERFNLSCERRHRALDDAKVILDFLKIAETEYDQLHIEAVMNKFLKKITLPKSISKTQIDYLPNTPGVFIFRNQKAELLYLAKAKNLYVDVTNYFANTTKKQLDILNELKEFEVLNCFGPLGTALKELQVLEVETPKFKKNIKQGLQYKTNNCNDRYEYFPFSGFLTIEETFDNNSGHVLIVKNWAIVSEIIYSADSFKCNEFKLGYTNDEIFSNIKNYIKKGQFKVLNESDYNLLLQNIV